MIVLHYLENSRAHRVLWLLEELGVPYEVKVYKRLASLRAPESLKALHPLGKSPIISDDGEVVAESGAIFDHLIRRHGGSALVPAPDSKAYRDYVYWMHYAEGSAMPLLAMKLIFAQIPSKLPFLIRPIGRMISSGVQKSLIDPQLDDHVRLWETSLAGSGWFAGDSFSAADIMMSFPVEAGSSRIDYGDTPNIARYLAAIRSRPAYQRALGRDVRYDYGDRAA